MKKSVRKANLVLENKSHKFKNSLSGTMGIDNLF